MKNIVTILSICILYSSTCFVQLKGQTDSLQIGFLMASTFADRWQKERDYFIEEANRLGAKVLYIDCYDVVDNQIEGAEKMVAAKVNGVVIVAVDAQLSAPAVKIIKDANIPILAYDRMILNADLDYYVTFNSIDVGEMMANEVLSRVNKGNVLFISGPATDYNSKFIREGVFNVLNKAGSQYKVSSIKTEIWNPLDSYMGMQNYLDNGNPMPNAVITAADVLARGVIEVLMENDALGKVIVTGQDAELDICKYIAQDKMHMSVYKPGNMIVKEAAKIILNAANNKKVETNATVNNQFKEVPTYYLKAIKVTKENLDEVIIGDNYYTRKQIYGN